MLGTNITLTDLNLCYSKLKAEGVKAFTAALTDNFILINLYLGHDQAKAVALYLNRNQAWLQQAFERLE